MVHLFCLCYVMYVLLNRAYGSSLYVVSKDTVRENNELAREWKDAVAA
jgi:intergrase/recombinase